MKLIDSISVFFPAFNEEENILQIVTKARGVLSEVADHWEIIVVDDGSTDKTSEIVRGVNDKNIKVITHKKNRGYGAALKSGYYAARYGWICFTDADQQFDFADFSKFIEKQKQTKADLVIGFYLNRKVSFFTKLTSRLWEFIIFIFFKLKVKDIDCGFKLVSKKVIDTIPKLKSERGAFISSELLIKAQRAGFRFAEVGVNHFPRKKGKGTGRNMKVIVKSFIDLFKLWRNKDY